MTIHDISLTITPALPVWSGDPPVRLSQPSHLERGDICTITRLDISAHTGTHLDAPAHFIRGGGTAAGKFFHTVENFFHGMENRRPADRH